MSKTSIFKKPDYCLSFGVDDVIFLDLEVKITRTGIDKQSFSLEIVKSQLASAQMEFACYLIKMLPADALATLNKDIESALTLELTPSLHSLFYAGDLIQDDQTQTKQAS